MAAHIAYGLVFVLEVMQTLQELTADGLGVLLQALVSQYLKHSASCSSGGRIGAVGVEHELLGHRAGDVFLGHNRANGEPVAKAFGHDNNVRDNFISLKPPEMLA